MFDHLAKGRFILGVSPGALRSDAEALGILDEDRNKMFAESIDVILAIWEREPPYDIDLPDNRFKVTTRKTRDRGDRPRHHVQALPEAAARDRRHRGRAVLQGRGRMGERDFHPLSANFLLPHWLKTHWTNYAEGKRKAGASADPADWRVARTIFVADDDKVAAALRPHDANSPTVLLQAAADQADQGRAPRRVQGRTRPARQRDHRRLRARPPGASTAR